MASIDELKNQIDLHDLASRLGLERPHDRGNYKSPHHKDKTPSLSIFEKNGSWGWKDWSGSDGAGGSCVDLVMYVQGVEVAEAIKILHNMYNIPFDRLPQQPRAQKSTIEYIADKCIPAADRAVEYLTSRGIDADVVRLAIKNGMVGFNTWSNTKVEPGQPMHGGDAAAFIVRTLNPGRVVGVDMRYLNVELNGGLKTQTQGDKLNYPWLSNIKAIKKAKTVYIVESPINALSIESVNMPYGTIAVATRGTGTIESINWSFLKGKHVMICMDNDDKVELTGKFPGQEAGWRLHELLTAQNITAHLVDQGGWEHNDVNDILQVDPEELKRLLAKREEWVIPGMYGGDEENKPKVKNRMFLPAHDYAQYWRYRAKEDFTRFVSKRKDTDDGVQLSYDDLCGFRVASISRIVIAGAVSVMTGDEDSAPHKMFSVSVQTAEDGNELVRRVFDRDHLYNVEKWKRLGAIYRQGDFLRMINIMARGADIGSRDAVNFVGLAWRDGQLKVNEGTDCYFSEPEKQCPYHNLIFPTGTRDDGRRVVEAYQDTFKENAGAIALVWALGSHLKALLGFWPHLVMESNKGAGKSTFLKRMERTLAMTVFSGQSLQTEFRLLTSVSHTTHPVGWEEISARKQEVIDKAVSLLQEAYQYSITRRGSDMTEYLICAPVLLAGEDVPVRSLLGKVVATNLSGKKGPEMSEDLPRFPLREWMEYVSCLTRTQVMSLYQRHRERCIKRSAARETDDGAVRMAGNYAAITTAWQLLCDFMEISEQQGGFLDSLVAEMNHQVMETSADREPWVWIIEMLLSEIDNGRYAFPYKWDIIREEHERVNEGTPCLLVRTNQIMDHIAGTQALRDKWNNLPVKTNKVFRRQLMGSGVVEEDNLERTIGKRRVSNMVALSIKELKKFGLHASPVEETEPGASGKMFPD